MPFVFTTITGCHTASTSTSYAPPPKKAFVESLDVMVNDFYGRPDVYANIKGRLTSNAAQLSDVQQSRGKDNVIYFTVNEQTPRGGVGTNRMPSPPFQTRVPVETLGLMPGRDYIIDANGVRAHFKMPDANEDRSVSSSSTTTGFEAPRG